MPPKPLSSVNADAEIYVGASMPRLFVPQLVPIVAEIIANASDIEYHLGGMLATLLGANAGPSIAIFNTLNSNYLQENALRAAAKPLFELRPQHREMFEAILEQTKRARVHRNHFAHRIWAYSRQVSNAILLIDPKALIEHDVQAKSLGAPHNGRGLLSPIDRSRVYVYTKEDLDEILSELDQASYCISHFRMLLIPMRLDDHEQHDRTLNHLLSRSYFEKALSGIRKPHGS